MSFRIAALFIALFAICISVVQAVPSPTVGRSLDTNGRRFSRGLPPLPPVHKKRTGSKVLAAKRHHPSSAPTTPYTGKIKVTRGGTVVGYVSKSLNNDAYTITNSQNSAATFSFTALTTGSSTQLELKDTSNNRLFTPFIGGAGSSSLAPGSGSFVPLAGVSHTDDGAKPQFGTTTLSTFGYVESSIWNYNPSTKILSAQWINSNGASPTTLIYYNPSSGGTLVLTGDGNKYDDAYPSAYLVAFTLV